MMRLWWDLTKPSWPICWDLLSGIGFAPNHFHAFSNVEGNVRRQIQKVKSHPWIPKTVPVRGFVYNVKTGRLHEVADRESEPRFEGSIRVR
jgi:carbonic anhydrase